MQHIAAGQIERRGDFRLSGGFGMALLFHPFRAGKAQFHACKGVNGVINAAMVGNIAAGHAGVCRIDDGIALQRGNVTLPEIQPRLDGCQVGNIRDALCGGFALQIGVLRLQEIRANTLRCANIHQTTQKLTLAVYIGRYAHIPIFCFLFQKRLDEKQPPLCLGHFSTALTK